MSEPKVEESVRPSGKVGAFLLGCVVAGVGVGGGGYSVVNSQLKEAQIKARGELSRQSAEHQAEKQKLLADHANRVVSIAKSTAEAKKITAVDATVNGEKVTVRYLDGKGTKQELVDVPIAKPAVPAPVTPAAPVPPVEDIVALKAAWGVKEKGYLATIERLRKQLVSTASVKPKEAQAELKAGASGWMKLGELEGAAVVKSPFEKGLSTIDPDPNAKFSLSEPRELSTSQEGGRVLGLVRAGRVVTIKQVKVVQGSVFGLVSLVN